MVVTTMDGQETALEAVGQYLLTFAEPWLLDNLEAWHWGTQVPVPPHAGVRAHIPVIDDAFVIAAARKAFSTTPTGTAARAASFSARTIKLIKHTDAAGIEDVMAAQMSLRNLMERKALALVQGMAMAMNTLVLEGNATESVDGVTDGSDSGETNVMWVSPNYDNPGSTGTAYGSVAAGTLVNAEAFSKMRQKLRRNNAMTFAEVGKRFIAMVSSMTTHTLQVNIAANNLSFEDSSMNRAQFFTDNIVGPLFGCMFIEADGSCLDVTATHGLNTGVAGKVNLVFGVDAFYVAEALSMPTQLIPHGFGDAVVADDTADEYATLAIKSLFGMVNGDRTTRMGHITVPE